MIINGLICEGPKCKKGANGDRMNISWSPDRIKSTPETMPDAFFRFSTWQPMYEEPTRNPNQEVRMYQFCSTGCTRDFLAEVIPPLSPREQTAVAENNKAVDEKNAAKKPAVVKLDKPALVEAS